MKENFLKFGTQFNERDKKIFNIINYSKDRFFSSFKLLFKKIFENRGLLTRFYNLLAIFDLPEVTSRL